MIENKKITLFQNRVIFLFATLFFLTQFSSNTYKILAIIIYSLFDFVIFCVQN